MGCLGLFVLLIGGCSKAEEPAGNISLIPATVNGIERMKVISRGEPVTLRNHAVPGFVTVFECTSSRVPAWRQFSLDLVQVQNRHPSVMLRRVDVLDRKPGELTNNDFTSAPYVLLFDKEGVSRRGYGPTRESNRMAEVEADLKGLLAR